MEHPKIEILNKSIVDWIQENFVKAVMPFNAVKGEFKFHKVDKISRVWKENNYWIVEALIEYGHTTTAKLKIITFQVDNEGNIIGYNIHNSNDI